MTDALTDSPRLLNKLIPPMVGTSTGGTLGWQVQSEGWDVISAQGGSSSLFRWRGFIDLAGYDREQLTFFIQNAQVTESGSPAALVMSLKSSIASARYRLLTKTLTW